MITSGSSHLASEAKCTRDYLARSMAPKMGLTHQDSRRYLDLFLEEITKALKQGDEVVFRGFGRFTPVEREARITPSFSEKSGKGLRPPQNEGKPIRFSFYDGISLERFKNNSRILLQM